MLFLSLSMLVVSLISTILAICPFFLSNKHASFNNSLTVYECGFNPISPIQASFSIRFFFLLLIFLIFDLELTFFFMILTHPLYLALMNNAHLLLRRLRVVSVCILILLTVQWITYNYAVYVSSVCVF